ncbi:MAG: WG repeat-containing protein [Janthinobacterium lividum]
MRSAFLLAGCLLTFPGLAQRPDAVVARLKRQGFLISSATLAPYAAYRLNRNGTLSVGPATPVYYFDQQGQPLPGSPYEAHSEAFGNWPHFPHRAFVRRNGWWGAINSRGEVVAPFEFDLLEPSYHPAGWLKFRQAGKAGLLDSTGRVVLPPLYDEIGFFSGGLCAVKQGGKWGFLDEAAHQRIPPTYGQVVVDFHEGFAAVVLPNTFLIGFINRQGHSYTGFHYPAPTCIKVFHPHNPDPTLYYQFRHGYAVIRNEACEIGAIDTLGRVVLPMRFYTIAVTDSTLTGYRNKEKLVYRLPRR